MVERCIGGLNKRSTVKTVQFNEKLDDNLSDIRGDVRVLNHRIADLEMEVEKLKNR